MKVALVIGRYNARGGGAERWTDRHARYLIARGVEVHLVAGGFVDPPREALCHRVGRGWTTGSRLSFAERVERLCRREGFDVVHDMGDGWHADFFMPHHGTRVAGLEHNLAMFSPVARRIQDWAHRWMPRYREFDELERRQYSLERSTTYIAISRMVRRHMQEYFHVPTDRIRLVYNGVDTERFRPSDNRMTHRPIGWNDRVVYLLVAHNFQLKGLDSLIRATSILRRDKLPVGLAVIGSDRPGPYRRLARRLGCADSVRFLGNQPDPIPHYQSADVYVQPTYYDPCSLVVLEALACGLPVVTTAQNGAAELLTEGREGKVLSSPKDVEGLANAMRGYLDMDYRTASSRAARRLAQQHTLGHNSSAILDLYRERMGLNASASRLIA